MICERTSFITKTRNRRFLKNFNLIFMTCSIAYLIKFRMSHLILFSLTNFIPFNGLWNWTIISCRLSEKMCFSNGSFTLLKHAVMYLFLGVILSRRSNYPNFTAHYFATIDTVSTYKYEIIYIDLVNVILRKCWIVDHW